MTRNDIILFSEKLIQLRIYTNMRYGHSVQQSYRNDW